MISGTRAGFARRLAALVYDSFLLAALLMVFTGGALFFTHGVAVLPATAGNWVYVYRTGLVLVIAGYYALNWRRSGQTLGMRAWRLRTVSDSGRTLGWTAVILRLCFGFIAWAPAALGVLWLYLDPEHLALQDRFSRTRVIHLSSS
ncbi:MAG TPA: RDD family protein [Steroidobacteraceae bacterium]|nr:RDD family protein [Steroidobacteraceae bacterium]